ncbi:MAG TPA: hypothetical protein VMV79_01780 [Alphaproteobacteria bacterium]|nr:hypothetical protein [Alphaproteobacteria bacterium]
MSLNGERHLFGIREQNFEPAPPDFIANPASQTRFKAPDGRFDNFGILQKTLHPLRPLGQHTRLGLRFSPQFIVMACVRLPAKLVRAGAQALRQRTQAFGQGRLPCVGRFHRIAFFRWRFFPPAPAIHLEFLARMAFVDAVENCRAAVIVKTKLSFRFGIRPENPAFVERNAAARFGQAWRRRPVFRQVPS